MFPFMRKCLYRMLEEYVIEYILNNSRKEDLLKFLFLVLFHTYYVV